VTLHGVTAASIAGEADGAGLIAWAMANSGAD